MGRIFDRPDMKSKYPVCAADEMFGSGRSLCHENEPSDPEAGFVWRTGLFLQPKK